MKDPMESIESELKARRDYQSPPLHLWNPPLSGDIAIRIEPDGSWYHEGVKIERETLVCLFACILRRESDGDYYLVTPHEKWRIEVVLHPLLVTDFDRSRVDGRPVLIATLNTRKQVEVSQESPLYLDSSAGGVAVLRLPHGLTALSTRAAWYRLIDMAESEEGESILRSGDFELKLPPS